MALKVKIPRSWWKWEAVENPSPYRSWRKVISEEVIEWLEINEIPYKIGALKYPDVSQGKKPKPKQDTYLSFANNREGITFCLAWGIPLEKSHIYLGSITSWIQMLTSYHLSSFPRYSSTKI